jgi:hypothetical protein
VSCQASLESHYVSEWKPSGLYRQYRTGQSGTDATSLTGAVSDGWALVQLRELSSTASATARLLKMEARESSELVGCKGMLRSTARGESAGAGLAFIDCVWSFATSSVYRGRRRWTMRSCQWRARAGYKTHELD